MLLKPFGNAHHECDFQTELRADSWALETSQYAHSIQKTCGTSSRYSLKVLGRSRSCTSPGHTQAFHSIKRRYLNVKDILLTYQGQVARFQLLACNLLLVAQEIVASFTC